MKNSKRNQQRARAKAERYSESGPPKVSKYAAKLRYGVTSSNAMSEQLAAYDRIERAQAEAAFPSLTGGEQDDA